MSRESSNISIKDNKVIKIKLNKFYIEMSKKLGIPAIITIDTHYNKFEEKMLKMSASAMAYHNKDYASSGEAFRGNTYYFMTQEEVRSNLRSMGIEDDDIDILIKNTEDLAHSVLLDLGLNFQEILLQYRRGIWLQRVH